MTVTPAFQSDEVTLHHGDCLDVLRSMPDCSVDSVVTDPPYGLEFMGQSADALWRESGVNADAGFHGGGISATRTLPSFTGSTNPKCLRCKGTRRGRRDGTAKVAVCLCADGGSFPNVRAVEMRAFQAWCDQWVAECLRVLKPGGYLLAFGGTRSWHRLAVSVEDAGFEIRDSIAWMYGNGFPKSMNMGDGLGTALKPAFEPIVVARKPLAGTVAANLDMHGTGAINIDASRNGGRFPTNVLLDESQAQGWDEARFFYTAKADSAERPVVDGIAHPTVKPLDLMRYLVRLVTPKGGVVLEPFAGSGTTLEAAVLEGFHAIGIEREADYIPLIIKRLDKPHEVGLDLFGDVA